MQYNTLSLQYSMVPVDTLSGSRQLIYRVVIVQTVASGCCDFIAQCIMVSINHCTNMNHPFTH